ncbi:TetR family transcriptional regulator [Microlunatus endophyticus]|uniref:TetR family transcriptional regulator n=1 Tax=Microlunatus endophyticus TaxID=1716077 RepID=A0A917W7Q8_9ACTN|nr:TetR/AcrR family transcriptional regulator [Microlunatus endophyticus]GGL80678.1 TetR family transcriptional regulator [Microlunatus endophyticus]
MDASPGVREQKKLRTRHRLGHVAAGLFAEHGYDAVSVSDIARAAGVADQTVYNYFPTKPDLVLDRAEETIERSRRLVVERQPGTTPADAIRVLVQEDVDRFLADSAIARGEFAALCLRSQQVRRRALAFRNDQAHAIADAIAETDPALHPLIALTHAHGLVAVLQAITDGIGAAILNDTSRETVAKTLRADANLALTDAAENFRATQSRAS